MDGRISQFASQQREVVAREQDEVENLRFLLENLRTDELESLGYALVGLRVAGVAPSVGGKSVLTLEAPVAGSSLPRSTLRTGSMVELVGPRGAEPEPESGGRQGATKAAQPPTGVVSKITDSSVAVILDRSPAVLKKWGGRCSVKVRASDVTHQRMLAALQTLGSFRGRRPNLHRVMFGDGQPQFGSAQAAVADGAFLDASLNDEQRAAVRLAVAARDVALIHGPPGTGKTHTLVEVIRQLLAQGRRLLVCGASNMAVDNIAERLARISGIKLVRTGHSAKITKPVLELTVGAQVARADEGTPLGGKRAELAVLTRRAKRARNPEAREAIRAQMRVLRREINAHTAKAGKQVLGGARVVLSTLCGAGSRDLDRHAFDVVIIDEATQALEAECWIAAIKAPKLILAGDHHQLPPTLISQANQQNRRRAQETATGAAAAPASQGDLMYTTMFERVRTMFGERVCLMLTTQYRMHVDIAKVSSERLYDGRLVAHASVASHVLADLAHVVRTEHTATPLVFVDTSDAGCHEAMEKTKWMSLSRLGRPVRVSKSMVNAREAQLVVAHVERLVAAGLPPRDIAVISPYAGQVRLLRLLCRGIKDLEIGSVDGFQGGEREAVVLSLVRSNPKREIGFLSDYRRMNVAVTRARRHLCVIGDGDTVCAKSEFLHALVTHMDAVALLQPVS
ncbi:hypothetical protein IWQ56_002859 [Coemansia nantahalensis]|uniref:Uncharacterized protein n=1 Tax=Coemansia nantahalensis TaxID=2789366 RepID=A0ACC1K9B5_9FUNG|nr:hypothetical protein IWQ56_002859 [Coemansia nantahalensis]KAJ2775776.1 hypothetical protein IWQ57_000186 [Coemansia nantahalensis]